MPLTSSNLFWRLKLIKLVSMRTRYGGTRALLCCKNRDEATCVLYLGYVRQIVNGNNETAGAMSEGVSVQ